MIDVCQLPQWQIFLIALIVPIATSFIELWLGKTEKVKASSILELIFNLIKLMVRK